MYLKKLFLASLLAVAWLPAQTVRSVCALGCPYSTLPEALNASATGDVIELAAGEVFNGPVEIIAARGITIRSSRWRELPAPGYRIDPERDAPLLATVRASNFEPALIMGATENAMAFQGINLSDNTITFDYAPPTSTFSNGTAVVCRARTDFLSTMPAPLVRGRKYWIRDWNLSTRRGRLAETPDGPPVVLTSIGSTNAPYYYDRPACVFWEQPRDIRITGVRFDIAPTAPTRNLVQIGNNTETSPREMGPLGITLRHTVITGHPDRDGPFFCLALFGGYRLTVADSWIGHCKLSGGNESKAIGIQNVVDARIENNYISGASINLLTAGGDSASGDVNRDLVITGNFFEKPGYMLYREGAEEPTGSCYYGGGSGAFYRRTSVTPNTCANGACYTCQPDKTWAVNTSAVYRSSTYLTKNLLELKDCENCRIEGNFFQGSYAGPDSGQGWCYGISVGVSAAGISGFGTGYHRGHQIYFRNNWADHCYSGIVAGNSAYDEVFRQVPLRDIVFENNLMTNLGVYPALSQWSSPNVVQRFILKLSTGIQGLRFANNTFRGTANLGMLLYKTPYVPSNIRDAQVDNNLIRFSDYSIFLDSSALDCNPTGIFNFFPNEGAKRFRNNVFMGGTGFLSNGNCSATIAQSTAFVADEAAVGFAGSDDHRLIPTSPFSAANPAAVQTSLDGSDVGADIDMVEQYAGAARLGQPPAPARLRLSVIPGSRAAVIRFRRPVAGEACEVNLYQGARTLDRQHADTVAASLDARASSVLSGDSIQFAVGTESALTPSTAYSYAVTCGALRAVGRFETLAEMLEPARIRRKFHHAAAHAVRLEHSTTLDFASPTQLDPVVLTDGSADVTFELPAGLRYWRAQFLDESLAPLGDPGQIHLSIAP